MKTQKSFGRCKFPFHDAFLVPNLAQKKMEKDQANELINILGEKNIERVFDIVGEARVSFATLYARIRRQYILKALDIGEPVASIAKRFEISRMTVYRIIHEERRLRKREKSGNQRG